MFKQVRFLDRQLILNRFKYPINTMDWCIDPIGNFFLFQIMLPYQENVSLRNPRIKNILDAEFTPPFIHDYTERNGHITYTINTKGRWIASAEGQLILFQYEEDALMFKMRHT